MERMNMAGKKKSTEDRTITPKMVMVAGKIHERLEQWKASTGALRRLKVALPGHKLDTALVKTATVNGLYGTNVYAQVRMAKHVSRVMAKWEKNPSTDEDLVDELSLLKADGDIPERRHTSFASKYAHFFVDEDRFPIYDSIAIRMVRWHLSRALNSKYREKPYSSFCQEFRELREKHKLTQSDHAVDQYLWLAGQYRQWKDRKAGKKWTGNAELGRLFEDPDEAMTDLLQDLCHQRTR